MVAAAELPRYSYSVDAEDRLDWVGTTWLAFARENGAAHLTAKSALGQSLWSFIEGEQTRQLYRTLLKQVRERRSRMIVPFRCDSPRLRRYMRLSISARRDDRVRLDGILVKTEPRAHLEVVDTSISRTDQILTICSLCQRALIDSVGWVDIEAAVGRLHLLEGAAHPQLRYEVCSDCESSSMMRSAAS
jgi:hypothetical protein